MNREAAQLGAIAGSLGNSTQGRTIKPRFARMRAGVCGEDYEHRHKRIH